VEKAGILTMQMKIYKNAEYIVIDLKARSFRWMLHVVRMNEN
jgi:hypothetical protein